MVSYGTCKPSCIDADGNTDGNDSVEDEEVSDNADDSNFEESGYFNAGGDILESQVSGEVENGLSDPLESDPMTQVQNPEVMPNLHTAALQPNFLGVPMNEIPKDDICVSDQIQTPLELDDEGWPNKHPQFDPEAFMDSHPFKLGMQFRDYKEFKAAIIMYKLKNGFELSLPNGADLYAVRHEDKQFVVDLGAKACSCFAWSLSGIPCKHAVAVIGWLRRKTEAYVDPFYHTSTYINLYNMVINPTRSSDEWEKSGGGPVLPPIKHIQPGRPPKKRRIRDPDEPRNPYKLKRQQHTVKCSKCGQQGHNIKTCKRQRPKPSQSQQGSNATPLTSQPYGGNIPDSQENATTKNTEKDMTYNRMDFRIPINPPAKKGGARKTIQLSNLMSTQVSATGTTSANEGASGFQ
ncbi:hypothetical protein Tsubulata_038645 [Turnera subulata]|uniref:SWIM-type domain-containing protein n=1 Tax=Turnera subulata TaxID=218843 RepID=A0A9Q0F8M1_9ROSI|nr:hypothetical protein Tsubulata_038645 [Turnera subulata]